jgi:hypothetical protein
VCVVSPRCTKDAQDHYQILFLTLQLSALYVNWYIQVHIYDLPTSSYLYTKVVSNWMYVGLLLNGYVQGAWHPNPYSLHRLLCALAGVDGCLYRDKVKQNEADPQMLVAAWTRILVILLINCASWVLADIITEFSVPSRNVTETQDVGFLYNCSP